MSRLCLVFVLVAVVVVVVPTDARPHKCEQRERSLADLELAEDSLNRAKQLYPNCEEDNKRSNSSGCSKKDKSLGFIDVALDLVSNAKKNIPLCPHIPTEEPLTPTEEPLTSTEEPLTSTEEPLTSTEEPLTSTEEPLTPTEEPLTSTDEPFTSTVELLTSTEEPLTPTELPMTTAEEPTPEVTTEDFRPMDCQDLLAAGHVTSGVYSVWLQGGKSTVRVRCDMDTDEGGWTVIQRRGNFGKQEDFNRNWQDYKHGFGSLERDFWLGNDNIFALSNQGNYSLRMDMTAADNDSAYALYQEFRIEDENANYKLHLGDYTGTAGNYTIRFDNKMFSTKDRKNSKEDPSNCAVERKGGFWHWDCRNYWNCNPNGLYNPGVRGETSMYYYGFKQSVGLSSFDMKLKRRW